MFIFSCKLSSNPLLQHFCNIISSLSLWYISKGLFWWNISSTNFFIFAHCMQRLLHSFVVALFFCGNMSSVFKFISSLLYQYNDILVHMNVLLLHLHNNVLAHLNDLLLHICNNVFENSILMVFFFHLFFSIFISFGFVIMFIFNRVIFWFVVKYYCKFCFIAMLSFAPISSFKFIIILVLCHHNLALCSTA